MYREIQEEEIKLDSTLGYQYFIDREHPFVNKRPFRVYLHRHVASVKYGRWLNKEEHVHHIDGNKVNNHPDNLEVLSAKEHAHKHLGFAKPYVPKQRRTKISWPDSKKLKEMVNSSNYSAVGRKLGVSGNAVSKRLKSFRSSIE